MEGLYEHSCVECGKCFSRASNLYRHARIKHNASKHVTVCNKVKCVICNSEFISKKALQEHIQLYHDISFEKELLEFPTKEEFLVWKKKIEDEGVCSYIRKTGAKRGKNGVSVLYFYCHRSGIFNSKSQGKRSLKMLGSNKIDGTCPSMIRLEEKADGSGVKVEFLKTHVGHQNDLGRLRISDSEKKKIAEKLGENIPIEAVLNDIRDSIGEKLERIHLLKHKDVLNIRSEFNINSDGMLDSSDEVSVRKWVENFQNDEDSPIILFKDQNMIDVDLFPGMKSEDFILVIMNRSQKDMLNLYGNDVICIDFTHGMNAYGFDLATVLVLDDNREGFPAAFILSNRQDSVALQLAFNALKKQVKLSPKVLMTDDAESFFNAWKSVFGEPERRLLCSWHVDKSWRKKTSQLISNKEKQAEVYKILRCLLSEMDEVAFYMMLNEALRIFHEDADLQEFGNYFEQFYSRRPEVWAYCFRKWSGINTNMHIERMHRTIKHVYLKGKKVKRLDKTLFFLMRFIRDKVFDRLISIERGKISSKISALRDRHKVSINLNSILISEKEDEWSVSSSTKDGEIYTILKKVECRKECALLCKECNYCLHNFTCTCLDNSVQWNMCKHIHFVCSHLKRKNEVSNVGTEKEGIICEANEELYICEDDKKEEKEAHISNLKKSRRYVNIAKVEYETSIQQMLSVTGNIGLKASTSAEREEILKIVETAMNAVQSCHEAHNNSFQSVEVSKEPSNKKIQPQRFFSTKKRPGAKKKSCSLLKPTYEEMQKISAGLVLSSKTK